MDRLWILEICIDIECSYLIIQCQLTNKNMLDAIPPRLAFVLIKFFESEKRKNDSVRQFVGPGGKAEGRLFSITSNRGMRKR